MRIRYIITLLLTGSIISGTALTFLFLNVAPSGIALALLFTILFFFFTLGIISAILISARSQGEHAWRAQFNLATSLRQGIVIGGLACLCLWLARLNILNFWILLILIFVTAFVEHQLLLPALREGKEAQE